VFDAAGQIFKGYSYDQRGLLSAILKPWGSELNSILHPNKKP